MDIVGFTRLSTSISAEELIDLINAFFSSIDKAADFINHVWKVQAGRERAREREREKERERERDHRLHSPFALNAPIQWAI